MGKTHLTV